MERKYWEKIAPDYDAEIFDVLHNDTKALIRSAIKKYSNKHKTVIDIGCAIGKWLPVLSPQFKSVLAVDISQKNLDIASSIHANLKNVQYARVDFSASKSIKYRADLAICINAILTSSAIKRARFFQNIYKAINYQGTLVLVVPSLESWLQTRVVQARWKIDRALFNQPISNTEAASRYKNMQQGNVEIDNVATKHYLEGELNLLLSREGFTVKECRKIEYNWKTEFVNPPEWLDAPRPWDWLVVARKD